MRYNVRQSDGGLVFGDIDRTLGLVLLVVLAIFLPGCTRGEGSFTLVNDSDDRISARVEVCDQVSEFDDVGPGEQVHGSYEVVGESSYDVSVDFASGDTLDREVGYVTSGVDFTHVVTVTTSSVEITGTAHSR